MYPRNSQSPPIAAPDLHLNPKERLRVSVSAKLRREATGLTAVWAFHFFLLPSAVGNINLRRTIDTVPMFN